MINELYTILLIIIGLSTPIIGTKYKLKGLQFSVIILTLSTTILSGFLYKSFGLTMSAGVPLFAAIFLSTDLIGEFYGKKKGMQTIIVTFSANIILLTLGYLVSRMIPIEPIGVSQAIHTLFTFIPRLLLGGLIAFIVSQTIDVYLFEKFRKKTQGKKLWLRNTGSTTISQLVDTAIIVTIAYANILDFSQLISLFISVYLIKFFIAIIDTPFCYLGRIIAKRNGITREVDY